MFKVVMVMQPTTCCEDYAVAVITFITALYPLVFKVFVTIQFHF